MGRRTVVRIETDEVWVIRRLWGPRAAWCPECAEAVGMLTPEEAVLLTGISARTIYRGAEEGRVHRMETAEGFLLVCPRSLARNCGVGQR